MSGSVHLSDSDVRQILAPAVRTADREDLLRAIAEEIRRTPQRRLLGWRLVRLWQRDWPLGASPSRRGWLEAAVVLAVALVGGALVGAGLLLPSTEPGPVVSPGRSPSLSPTSTAAPSGPTYTSSADLGPLLAVSSDEAWAANRFGLWHYLAGVWSGPVIARSLDGTRSTGAAGLAVLPDGRLVVASETGVLVQRGESWETVSAASARAMVVDARGSVWIVGAEGSSLWEFRYDGHGWTGRETGSCPVTGDLMVAASDGSIWTAGGFGWATSSVVARFDGRSCVDLDPLGRGYEGAILALAADRTGGVVVMTWDGSNYPEWDGNGLPQGTWSLLRWERGQWSTLYTDNRGWRFSSMAISPSGTIWAVDLFLLPRPNASMLSRYDGTLWYSIEIPVSMGGPITVGPDGTVWVGTVDGVIRVPVSAQ